MQVAIIPADPTDPIRFEDIEGTLDEYQDRVGGYIQVVGLTPCAMSMYLNEEGKLHGLPVNPRATVLARAYRGIRGDDVINGAALITGPVDSAGDDTGLTDDQILWLRTLQEQWADYVTRSAAAHQEGEGHQ